jgi:hypothetical protein
MLRVSPRDTEPFKYGFKLKKSCKSKTLKAGSGERPSVLKRSKIGKKFPIESVRILRSAP